MIYDNIPSYIGRCLKFDTCLIIYLENRVDFYFFLFKKKSINLNTFYTFCLNTLSLLNLTCYF